MARSETAQIIVQIRGAIKAAQDTERVAASQEHLGDEVDEAGRAALRTAAAYDLLQRQLNQVSRAATINAGAISLGTVALGAMLAVTLGLAITAMPALIAVLSAGTVVVGSFAAAILGVGAAAGVMAFAAIQRFKETADVAGSVANRLKQQAGLLQNAFADSTASGATAVLAGLIPLLRGVRGLVHDLEPAFTGLGQAMGGALRWFGEGVRELRPELADLFGAAEGVFQPLARIVLTFISLLARVGTAAMPYVIDALEWVADLFRSWQTAVTDGAVESAFALIGKAVSAVGALIGGIADVLGPVLGPAAEAMSAAFAGMGGDVGNVLGAILAAFVQLAQGALPGVVALFETLAPLLSDLIDSGVITQIGEGLSTGIKAGISYVKQLIGALEPMKPFLQNVILPIAAGIAVGLIGAFKAAIPVINMIAKVLGWVGEKAAPLRGFIQGVATVLTTIFAGGILKVIGLVGRLGGFLTQLISWIGRLGGPINAAIQIAIGAFNNLKTALSSVAEWVGSKIGDIVGAVKAMPGLISQGATGLWEGLKSGLMSVLRWVADKINWFIDKYNKVGGLISKLPGVPDITLGKIDLGGEPGSDGPLPGMPGGAPFLRARGGPIPGGAPFRDRVHALLTPGEHVLTRGEVAAAGGHQGVMQLRSALRGNGPSLAGALPPVHLTVPVQIDGREVGRAATRADLQDRSRQGETTT
jgi:hypothetical protein